MTFPGTPLDVRVELDLAGTWTDVTGFVDEGTSSIGITRGHPDESTTTTPSAAELTFHNTDGRFSSKNPAGAYYPDLARNIQARISVPAAGNYLRLEDDAMSSASTPDSVALSITGNIDVRIDVRLTSWAPCTLASKWLSPSQQSWSLSLNDDGTVTFTWSVTGSEVIGSGSPPPSAQSTQPVPLGRGIIRATLNTGSGTVTFFTAGATQINGPYTQLGATVVSGATSIFDSTAHVTAGNLGGAVAGGGAQGNIYELQIRSGIGGTIVADPVFSAQTAGAGSFTDAQSNVWTMNGTAEISDRDYRLHAEAVGWPPYWDVTGIDQKVDVALGGVLRRLGQGDQNSANSPLARAEVLQSGSLFPVAYWSMEDATGSTSLASGVGGPPMVFLGAKPNLAEDSTSFPGSQPLLQVNNAALRGQVPAYSGAGSIICRFCMFIPSGSEPGNNTRLVRLFTTGTCTEISLYYGTGGGLGLVGRSTTGTVFDTGIVAGFGLVGQPTYISVEITPQAGGNVLHNMLTLPVGATSGLEFSASFAGTVGNCTQVLVDPGRVVGAVTFGHLSVQADVSSLFALSGALDGWQGEAAGSRFARLCAEENLNPRIIGYPAATASMGLQTEETVSALLQECVDADRGMMFEPRQCPEGLGYRTLQSLCNQQNPLVLAYEQFEDPLQPTEDDQTTQNDITVQQSADGSSARQQLLTGALSVNPPPAGVGRYDTEITVNLQNDSDLNNEAGWILHAGTVDEQRFPAININLATSDPVTVNAFFALQELDIGDRIQVFPVPPWLPPDGIDQLISGVAENLYNKIFTMQFQGIPASIYTTGIFDAAALGLEPSLGKAQTDGSQLSSAITSTATTIHTTATGPSGIQWTPEAADYPFDVMVSGERMTMTACVGGLGVPQQFTVVRSVNGVVKAHAAGESVRLYPPPVFALV